MEPNVIHWLFIDNYRLPYAERASGHRWSFLRPVSNERQRSRSPRVGWQCFPRGVNFNRYLNRHLLYNATSLLRCPFLVLNMLIFFHTERICRTRHEDFAIRWWLGVCQRYSAMFDLAFISKSSFCQRLHLQSWRIVFLQVGNCVKKWKASAKINICIVKR